MPTQPEIAKKVWVTIPVNVADVKLMGRCICGRCSKNRDAICVCGSTYSSGLSLCPACGRPPWCEI